MKLHYNPNGPIILDSLFYEFYHLLNFKIYPNSIGGNKLHPKLYEKFKNIAYKNCSNNGIPNNTSNLKGIDGHFSLILIKQWSYSNYTPQYHLSIIKVKINFNETEQLYYITPLESHSLTSYSIDDLSQQYSNFKKYNQNGLDFTSFGSLLLDSEDSEIDLVIDSYVFKNDFKSLVSGNNTLSSFFHNIWAPIGLLTNRELYLFSLTIPFEKYKKHWLSNYTIELSCAVYEYLKSDIMVMPDDLKSTKFSNVEDYSDFSEYSDYDECEVRFDFSSTEFQDFFSAISESIKSFGGSVLPYLNGSYLQDGSWITNNTTLCTDLRDVILLLKSSTNWHGDSDSILKLFLYKVINHNNSTQFKLFYYDREIIIISQLFLNHVYDSLINNKQSHKLIRRILEFSNHKLLHLIPENLLNFVVDLYILNKSDEIYIMNIAPFNFNHEIIFPWDQIYEYATSRTPFTHDESVKVDYYGNIAFVVMSSNKLSRHKLYSFCSEDVEELAKILN
uniref:D123, putative n=1 Tax=Theileria annulata TaxID=5874 RepID=A0A3B0MWD5_THEAN